MSAINLTLLESFPIHDEASTSAAPAGPIIRVAACEQTVRLRRDIHADVGGRRWLLELEVAVQVPDPEQTLVGCHGFLVDTLDGEALGVVDDVELEAAAEGARASALLVASGWFGRRRLRVQAEQVEMVAPDERRLVVRKPAGGFRLERQR
jgi:hypothetical protein